MLRARCRRNAAGGGVLVAAPSGEGMVSCSTARGVPWWWSRGWAEPVFAARGLRSVRFTFYGSERRLRHVAAQDEARLT